MNERILIIDDEPNITSSFASLLQDQKLKPTTAIDIPTAERELKNGSFDLILLDLNLPGKSGVDFLVELMEQSFVPPVIVISGQSEISVALQAVRLGALDYLEKPVTPDRLIATVKSALMFARARRCQNLRLEEIDQSARIIGESCSIKRLLSEIEKAAPTDATVLIQGENGTGKELVASQLYIQSKRCDHPFIKVNCPGIPETLFESELFGHRKGAFTGAVKDHPGRFVQADGGTIFLDEIGDLPLSCQAKLLRVLQSGEVESLGEISPRTVDVRIICATNQNLQDLINRKQFREDLYYRISVLPIIAPPLRDRRDDIPLLIGEFLRQLAPSGETRLTPEAIAYISTMDYPGNIRQLKNLIERLTIICHDRTVDRSHVEQVCGGAIDTQKSREDESLTDRMRTFERNLISQVLTECEGNITRAARELKLDRANLSRKIRDLDLK